MKIVISPAKTLDYQTKLPSTRSTQPEFLETTTKINNSLKHLSKEELSKLMHISDKLTNLNYKRYHEFQTKHSKQNSRAAVYAFAGDVYTGVDTYSLPVEKLDQLQKKLRILSGFYGILRPLDLIQPYRLEMGIPLSIGSHKNLYSLWQQKLTSHLNQELKQGELFINLASQEYFKVINTKELKVPVITPVFKDYKNGKLKFISFYGKKARGAMVRYIVENNAETIEEIKGFNTDGYRFSEEESVTENELVFTR